MAKLKLDDSFRNHLLNSYPVGSELLDHLLDDLGEYFSSEPRDFICRRHRELQREGLRNEEIYRRILIELEERRFASPSFTVRQIRRTIYG